MVTIIGLTPLVGAMPSVRLEGDEALMGGVLICSSTPWAVDMSI